MLLPLLAACTSGPDPKDAGAGDTSSESGGESAGCTPDPVALTVTTAEAWHWEGEADARWEVPFTRGAACGTLTAEADGDWVVATVAEDVLQVQAAPVESGTHVATVRLLDGAVEVGRVTVTVRALHRPTGDSRRHALVVGVDGLDGDELARLDTPVLDLLRRHALWTDRATTQLTADTLSGPGWTSVLTGVEASKHGVTANGDYGLRNEKYPTFLWRLTHAGLAAAVAFQWPDLFVIVEPDAYEDATAGDMDAVTAGMEGYLATGSHDLYVVHLDDVDHAGHASGFSADNEAYAAAVAAVEASVTRFLNAITSRPGITEEDWLVVLTADHGGSGTSHGCRDPDCQTVPLLVAGARVPPGAIGTGSHLDVHPTLLRHFGLDPGAWDLDGVERLAPREDLCDDGVDGDGDGLLDCADEECVGNVACLACAPDALDGAVGLDVESVTFVSEDWVGSCGGDGAERPYTWTASMGGAWVFSTESSGEDTTLYLLDGGCDGAELACADEAPGLGGGRAALSVTLTAGQAVTLMVDSAAAIGDTTSLSILSPPTTCPDAVLDGGVTTVTGKLPTPTTGVQDDCATAFGPVLYAWTAPATGTWTFDTLGSAGDTVVYVLAGCGGETLACNDDGHGLQSVVSVDLTEGQAVVVAVGSFAGTTDTYILNVSG